MSRLPPLSWHHTYSCNFKPMSSFLAEMPAGLVRAQRSPPALAGVLPNPSCRISEVMLQQPHREFVLPYFRAGWSTFPASLSWLEHLSTRCFLCGRDWVTTAARATQRAAQIVVSEHGGRLPAEPAELRKLRHREIRPVIAWIGFGQDEPALDGNIRRVLAPCLQRTCAQAVTPGRRML